MAHIRLYSTGCPKCQVLEKKLDAIKADYEIITDIDLIKSVCEKTYNVSLPLLQIDEAWGEVTYNFSNAIKWIGGQINAN